MGADGIRADRPTLDNPGKRAAYREARFARGFAVVDDFALPADFRDAAGLVFAAGLALALAADLDFAAGFALAFALVAGLAFALTAGFVFFCDFGFAVGITDGILRFN